MTETLSLEDEEWEEERISGCYFRCISVGSELCIRRLGAPDWLPSEAAKRDPDLALLVLETSVSTARRVHPGVRSGAVPFKI